jgi:hypothetical protein
MSTEGMTASPSPLDPARDPPAALELPRRLAAYRPGGAWRGDLLAAS